MATKLDAVRFFKNRKGEILAVVFTEPELFLIRLVKNIAFIDMDPTLIGSYSDAVKSILSNVTDVSKLAVLPEKTIEFEGVEMQVKGFNTFDITLDKTSFVLEENSSYLGTVKKRDFNYDFSDEEIKAIAEENDARIKYYVKPKYFDFIKSNVSNSFIKGMALIGVPGTGKSTDAIAVVRELGGIVLIAQLSGGMLENNVFVNTKPNRILSKYINDISHDKKLTDDELDKYDLLSKSSSSFLEVDEVIIRAIKLNCPVLLDEFAYANILLKARFNVLTDGTVVFRHEGVDYPLPDNFFIFMTWNPGDTGTQDIPNALKSRFPIHIIEAIDKKTHYKRITSFITHELSYGKVDENWINSLYDFGNMVEAHQTSMRHNGGFFTIRATQMFLSSVLTECVDRDRFLLELRSKFVNALWGSNYERTAEINDKLFESTFNVLIAKIWDGYPIKPIEKVLKPINILDLVNEVIETPLSSTSSAVTGDDITEELNDIWGT